jgi:cystathionine beta-lyase/cystathionine gamma-synthase
MQPVFQTSTYAQPWPAKHTGYEYARTQNPTREALERAVAALESGKYGLAFGSGLAATETVLHSLPPGAKVVCSDDVYGGTYRQFKRVFEQRGYSFTFVDMLATPPEQAIPEGTTLVWIESPTNPLLKIADIAALAARAHAVGAIVAVDNTFATPIFQRPLELGADLVVHSMTKYLNGHSDVVGGIIVTARDDLHEKLRFLQNAVGAVPGPWDTWLVLRGLKTLHVRMERHQANAKKIVAWLAAHPEVERIHYPMLPTDPGYAIASKQMSGFGGMVSFVLKGSLERAERFCASTKLFTCAESLGGVESLIELPASMTHASVPVDERRARGIADGLIRLSIGIEDADDLIADLEQAVTASLG